MRIMEHPASFDVFTSDGIYIGSPFDTAVNAWDQGLLPLAPGEHKDLALFQPQSFVESGYETLMPMSLYLNLYVEQELYYGDLPLDKVSGFLDEHTGNVIANAFSTGHLDWENVRSNWHRLKKQPPKPPVFQFGALQCIGIED